jgi:alanyl aminopeptidase
LLAVALLPLLAWNSATAGLRLPKEAVPLDQEVTLRLDPAKDDYSGTVVAHVNVPKVTRTIHLHAGGPVVESAKLRTSTGKQIGLKASIEAKDILVLTAESTIPAGRHVLEIAFTSRYNTRADSLYKVVVAGEPYLFTQFEDTAAREAFPCWDEPSFKIPWKLTLTVPADLVALANTPIESESTSGGSRTVVFKKTPPLPSYLVALAVGRLETVPVPGTGIPTRIVTVRGKSGLAAEAVRQTPPLLAALERYFGKRYPFEKLDLLAVPDYWYGAMENPGAITFRETILLIDPKSNDAEERRHMAGTVAHELAHMWFGDLVTMAWWDDMWLNESFASWMGDKVVDEVYPELGTGVSQVADVERAKRFDGHHATRAMRQPVESQDVLLEAADTLAYNKGLAVLNMFEQWLGPETFRKGVIAYLDAHAWGNAKGSDLWNALAKASGKDVGGAMSSFLDQPGVPLVMAEPLPGGKVRLTQRRFLQDGSVPGTKQTWRIPVTLAFESAGKRQTKSVLLTAESVTIDLGPSHDWIHPNADERGYYRWSVPASALGALTGAARARLTPRERVGMIGNLGALFEAGLLAPGDYLTSLRRFGDDPDPEVLASLIVALKGLEEPFGDRAGRPALAAYVRSTLRPAWQRIGPEPRPGEPDSVGILRPDLRAMLGTLGEDPEVQAEARATTARYLADPSSVPPAIALRSLAIAARHGDMKLWEAFRARFESATTPLERASFLKALGAFYDPAIVRRALAYVLEGPLRPTETFDIPREMVRDPELEEIAYRWTKENYGEITKRIPPWGTALMPNSAEGCSPARVEDAKAFFSDPARAVPGTARSLDKVAENVTACARLRSRTGADVRAFLSSGGSTGVSAAAETP